MEVRTIKTCHGFQTLRFLDGALAPVDGLSMVALCEARKLRAEKEMYEALDEIIKQAFLSDLPQRKLEAHWLESQI
jgi:hypothetical protein